MSSCGSIVSASASVLIVFAVTGCDGSGSESPAPSQTAPSRSGAARQAVGSSAATVRCEGITPKPSWRRQTTAVGNLGLFVKHLASQARKLSNGNYLVKAGAVVAGDVPVTLRVPAALRGNVGLVYGDASRRRGRHPSTALTEVTFRPCPGKPRSGYVGGLIFGGEPRVVRLEVVSNGTIDPLTLRP